MVGDDWEGGEDGKAEDEGGKAEDEGNMAEDGWQHHKSAAVLAMSSRRSSMGQVTTSQRNYTVDDYGESTSMEMEMEMKTKTKTKTKMGLNADTVDINDGDSETKG